MPSLAWDLSKIPIFPPEQASRPQTSSPLVQPKFAIGQINDPLEHEADRVAEQIMTTPTREPSIASASPQISRMCADCEAEDEAQMLQTKRATTSEPAAGYAPGAVYKTIGSSGQPLDAAARTYFEPRFGHDFSRVRIHSDSAAHEAAASVDAKAYTVGSDVVFAAGQYAPHSPDGKQLLAHELTHVVQQAGGKAPRLIQRQVFHPRHHPAKPVKPHRPVPAKAVFGCTTEDLLIPEAVRCIDKMLDSNFPYETHIECSAKGIACCEEIPDPPHGTIKICDDPVPREQKRAPARRTK
jgi:hypothetical protein